MLLKRLQLWMRDNWKLSSALALATTAAIVGAIAAVHAPAVLPFVIGYHVFGYTPFAGLASAALPVAATAVAGISASVTLLASSLLNTVVRCSNYIGRKLAPSAELRDEVREYLEEQDRLEEQAARAREKQVQQETRRSAAEVQPGKSPFTLLSSLLPSSPWSSNKGPASEPLLDHANETELSARL